MIGDVNLFFSEWIEPNECEINIMIAEKEYRGMGIAKKILEIVERFASAKYHKNLIIAKIKKGNLASIKLFEKAGYKEINYNSKF
jgi:RimJ/RimL family protein N-acetyltransferase